MRRGGATVRSRSAIALLHLARRPGRLGRFAVAALLAFLAIAPSAAARTTVIAPAPSLWPYQQWVSEARVPTPPGDIQVVEGPEACGGTRPACTSLESPIEVNTLIVEGWRAWRRDFYHELGHHFDYTLMEEWSRLRFEELVGDVGRPWREAPNSPHEKFAEAWKFCALQPRLKRPATQWGYGYRPTRLLEAKVCHLIEVVGS